MRRCWQTGSCAVSPCRCRPRSRQGAIIGGGYAAATALLLTPRLRFDAALTTRGSLLLLLTVAFVSTAAVAGLYVLMLVAFGLLPAAEFGSAALRFWVGDMIGVAVLTPFLLVLMTRRRVLQPSWEAAALLILVAMAMFAVFGFAGAFRFQLFYLFFLPVIWTAVRFGLEGVTVGLLLTQIGLIAAIHFTEDAAADVTSYQALMVVLTLTGLCRRRPGQRAAAHAAAAAHQRGGAQSRLPARHHGRVRGRPGA